MLPSLRSIAALGTTAAAGAVLALGTAAPASAQEELPEQTEQPADAETTGDDGLLGPVLGQSGLVTVFIGNYQINH
ncbi:hypothetical protein [Nocardiopsis salina]|uniref:hypothetical protein n=1 Tax=Nocardiopsis salina TaxID=245836 RepID=UPI00034A875B|nr:hypothetical protein [Nocardiopsis salina]